MRAPSSVLGTVRNSMYVTIFGNYHVYDLSLYWTHADCTERPALPLPHDEIRGKTVKARAEIERV